MLESSALRFCRLPVAEAGALTGLLGGRALGAGDDGLRLLSATQPMLDAWCGTPALTSYQQGRVQVVTDGYWLHGHAEISDLDAAGGLQAASQRLYAEIFDVLAASPCTHLLRLWNYFADITGDDAGTERYRRFNIGRQQAFLDAQRSAFEGAPAACALGASHGPLRVYFLAGRHAPLAIENPRQVSAYRYPDRYGPRSPTFSRAALVAMGAGQLGLFISGTASIVGHASLHLGDVRRQTEECLANIDAVCDAAARRAGVAAFPAASLVSTIYVRNAADLAVVREVFERHVGPASAAARDAVYVQADVCRAELLVEIEAQVFAPCLEPRSPL